MKQIVAALLATLLLGLAAQSQATAPQQTNPASPANTPASAPPQTPSTPKPADSPLPSDPKEILELATKTNGLGGEDLKPWHLKASFETFDEKGKSQTKGSIEVSWAGPQRYKRIYTSPNYSQVEYGTEHGVYYKGDLTPPPYPEAIIVDQLLHPLPSQEEIDEFSPERREQNFGKMKLE